MSHASAHTQAPAEMTPITGFESLGQKFNVAATVALVLGLSFLLIGGIGSPEHLWGNVLLSGYNLTCVGLGGLFFIAVQALTSARWHDPLLAAPHAMPRTLPLGAVLMLLLYFGAEVVYPWARPEVVHHDAIIAGREAWLNKPFFWIRILVIYGLWIGFGQVLLRKHRYAAPFMALFAFSFALANFDWIMSVEPLWYSTIFAIYGFSGMFLQAIAIMILSAIALHRFGLLPGVEKSRNHDLGKLMFAFSCFWAYIWLSQFLLIWYANIPEETAPYRLMLSKGWGPLFFLNVVLNFVLPFLILMRRESKTHEPSLLWACGLILVGHWLDLYLMIFPALTKGAAPFIGLAEVGGALLTLGLAHFAIWGRMTQKAPTVPAH